MVQALKKCICGIPVTTGVRLVSFFEVIYGVIATIVFGAGLINVCSLFKAAIRPCM